MSEGLHHWLVQLMVSLRNKGPRSSAQVIVLVENVTTLASLVNLTDGTSSVFMS